MQHQMEDGSLKDVQAVFLAGQIPYGKRVAFLIGLPNSSLELTWRFCDRRKNSWGVCKLASEELKQGACWVTVMVLCSVRTL